MITRQVLRLGSSLALTRILFPEAFGLVATAGLLSAAVEMCSDLGLRQAIIQHPLGDSRRYLDSAWTMAVVRGMVLALIMWACAWPFALFFKEPLLSSMILVMSLGVILRGLTNPAMLLLDRNLQVGRVTALEVGSDVIRVSATITAAIALQNVWGLVIGGLMGETARLIGSFVVVRHMPRPFWDRQAVRELFRYGRFVMLSSLIGYGATRLDALFVAKFLGMEIAGVYYIATVLAMMFGELFMQIGARVFFPALSRRQDDRALLRRSTGEVVRILSIVVFPLGAVIAVNSNLVLRILYDPRYAEAALALRWLCGAACLTVLGYGINAPLMATGRPYFATVATATKLCVLCVAGPLLGAAWGMQGYAGAMAVAAAGHALVLVVGSSRHEYLPLSTLGRALLIPGMFLGAVLGLHSLLRVSAAGYLADVLILPVDAAVLGAMWLLYRVEISRFIPRPTRRMAGVVHV